MDYGTGVSISETQANITRNYWTIAYVDHLWQRQIHIFCTLGVIWTYSCIVLFQSSLRLIKLDLDSRITLPPARGYPPPTWGYSSLPLNDAPPCHLRILPPIQWCPSLLLEDTPPTRGCPFLPPSIGTLLRSLTTFRSSATALQAAVQPPSWFPRYTSVLA